MGGAAGSDEFHQYRYKYGTAAILTSFSWTSDEEGGGEAPVTPDNTDVNEQDVTTDNNTPVETNDPPVVPPAAGLWIVFLNM
jgi:hypothetical protein